MNLDEIPIKLFNGTQENFQQQKAQFETFCTVKKKKFIINF